MTKIKMAIDLSQAREGVIIKWPRVVQAFHSIIDQSKDYIVDTFLLLFFS